MSNELSGRAREILLEKNFATVSTLRQDGTVHAVVVWVDADDEGLRAAQYRAEGRGWRKNVARDPGVTVTVANHANPYEYVSVTETVVEDTHDRADEHINRMAKKYADQDVYPFRQPGEQRVKIRVRPDRVTLPGGASEHGEPRYPSRKRYVIGTNRPTSPLPAVSRTIGAAGT